MDDREKNIIYTARDIEQYLAGKLSPLQMHAMEKASLDDPFLAEAMEGYEGMPDKEWNNQLVALREEIAILTERAALQLERPPLKPERALDIPEVAVDRRQVDE